MKGLLTNIQKFSVDDGPGIRTTIFLKGCNLRCLWCHNPETIYPKKQIQFFQLKCSNCGRCIEVCTNHVHSFYNGKRKFSANLCRLCGKCVNECSTGALDICGKEVSVDEVICEIEKDMPFYKTSNGGVTFSGGEALLQKSFLKELLKECKVRGIHTAVDTAGNVQWKVFEEILPFVDLFLFDIKLYDCKKHEAATGTGNQLILDNIKCLSETGSKIWIRIPIIPGINDKIEEIDQIAAFIQKLKNIESIELLPYHQLGESKYKSLGWQYKLKGCTPPEKGFMTKLIDIFQQRGLNVKTKV